MSSSRRHASRGGASRATSDGGGQIVGHWRDTGRRPKRRLRNAMAVVVAAATNTDVPTCSTLTLLLPPRLLLPIRRPMLLSVHVPDNDGQISCRAWGLRRDQGTTTGADWWACGRRRHPPRSLRCLCLCLPIREPIRCHRRASLQHRRHPEPSLAPSRGATGDPRALSDWPQAGAIARTRQPRALFLPQPAIQSLARQAAMSRSSRFLFSSSSDEY